MSNFSQDELDKIILLENALRDRNLMITRLQEQLKQADQAYNLLHVENKSLRKALKAIGEV